MTNDFKTYISIVETKLKLAEDVRKHYGRILAPQFNSIDFWNLNENKVSQILAYFLNPKETHEQGDKFLKIFCDKIKIEYQFTHFHSIEVKCERTTDSGRKIDISISKNNDEFVLAIENKIYIETVDQQNQIRDYLSFLKKITKGNYCLIYLSPKQKDLSELSISKDQRDEYINNKELLLISYEDYLLDCLNDFRINCEADNVKSFLKDFQNKLKNMYVGETFIDEQKMLVEYAMQNNENLTIALKISQAISEVKNNLKKEIENQLLEISHEMDIRIEEFKIIPLNWIKYSIDFSFEQGGIIYGIKRREIDKKKSTLPEIIDLIGGDWKISEWWPMWQFMYKNIDVNIQFWLDINNGTFKAKALSFITKIFENFNNTTY